MGILFIPVPALVLSLDLLAIHSLEGVIRWLAQQFKYLCTDFAMRSLYIHLALASAAVVSANPLLGLFDRNTCDADDCAR
jgi:hypothetical protein